ncbi:MAG: hypothetical protein ACJAXJ_000641 [Colwellia sp.]|jgi:hypothetical protein
MRYLITTILILLISLQANADKDTKILSQKFQAAANTCNKIHTGFLGNLAKGTCIKSCTNAAKRAAAFNNLAQGKKQIQKDLQGCIFALDLSKTKTPQLADLKIIQKILKTGKLPNNSASKNKSTIAKNKPVQTKVSPNFPKTSPPSINRPKPGNSAPMFGNSRAKNNQLKKADDNLTPYVRTVDIIYQVNISLGKCNLYGSSNCINTCKAASEASQSFNKFVETERRPNQVKAQSKLLKKSIYDCNKEFTKAKPDQIKRAMWLNDYIVKNPTIFAQWHKNSNTVINQERDKNPTSYLDQIIANSAKALKTCSGANVHSCKRQCDSSARIIQMKEYIKKGTATWQIQEFGSSLREALGRCKTHNNVPAVIQNIQLAEHIANHPEVFSNKEGVLPFYTSNDKTVRYPLKISRNNIVPKTLTTKTKQLISNKPLPFTDASGNINQPKLQQIVGTLWKQCNKTDKACLDSCSLVTATVGKTLGNTRPTRKRRGRSSEYTINKYIDSSAKCLNSLSATNKVSNEIKAVAKYHQLLLNSTYPRYNDTSKALFKHGLFQVSQIKNICNTTQRSDCYITCSNAVSSLNSLDTLLTRKISEPQLEQLAANYIEQCIVLAKPYYGGDISRMVKLNTALKKQEFTAPLSKNMKSAHYGVQPKQNKEQEALFNRYPLESNAPYLNIKPKDNFIIRPTFNETLDAFVTLSNYYPDSVKEECNLKFGADPRHKLPQALSAIYDDNYTEIDKKNAATDILNFTYRRSDNAATDKSLRKIESCITRWQQFSKEKTPEKLEILSMFEKDLFAIAPSRGMKSNNRKYCDSSLKNNGNPFLKLTECELLSSIYYRDFEKVVMLEKLWVEPVLQNTINLSNGDDIISTFVRNHNQSLLNNSEKMSMVPLIVINYLTDYPVLHRSCMSDKAKIYTYQDTKVTEFKNRYGYTLRSNTTTRERSYKVNPDWVPIYDKLKLRFSEEGTGMMSMLDLMYSKIDTVKSAEYNYGEKRPKLKNVLQDIYSFMRQNKCNSSEAKKFDSRLKELNEFRIAMGQTTHR